MHIFYIYTKGTLYLLKTTETFTHDDDRNNNNNLSTYSIHRRTTDEGNAFRWAYCNRCTRYAHTTFGAKATQHITCESISPFKRHSLSSFEILSGIPAYRIPTAIRLLRILAPHYGWNINIPCDVFLTRIDWECKRKIAVDTIKFHFMLKKTRRKELCILFGLRMYYGPNGSQPNEKEGREREKGKNQIQGLPRHLYTHTHTHPASERWCFGVCRHKYPNERQREMPMER